MNQILYFHSPVKSRKIPTYPIISTDTQNSTHNFEIIISCQTIFFLFFSINKRFNPYTNNVRNTIISLKSSQQVSDIVHVCSLYAL